VTGTVPLYTYWNPTYDDNASAAGPATINTLVASGYTLVRIEGYVYPAT
jgi:hypothetical protein